MQAPLSPRSDPAVLRAKAPDPSAVIGWLGRQTGLDIAAAEAVRARAEGQGQAAFPQLLRAGLVSEADLARAFAELTGLPLVSADRLVPREGLATALPLRFMKDAKVLPLDDDGRVLTIALADPSEEWIPTAVALKTGRILACVLASPGAIEAAVERHFGAGRSKLSEMTEGLAIGEGEDAESALSDSDAPVARMVRHILERAVAEGASDIHIEPAERRLILRYRVDGALREEEAPPLSSAAAIVSRIKVLSGLDIAERRLPQDGRASARVAGRQFDLRVATVPTVHGEGVVIRLLAKSAGRFDLGALGLEPEAEAHLAREARRPHGLLLVTGPTGAGKTTTLYALISTMNVLDRKIVTIEDPVEYRIEGLNQIQVKPDIGLTFPAALRSVLRQDPDVIMVGEMRDAATAQIAIQSALTGHLVLTTLHTNTAIGAVTRLRDLGVPDYLVAGTLNVALAQRLVRRLCESCAAPDPEPAATLAALGEAGIPADPARLRVPAGCASCGGSGFAGRIALIEILQAGAWLAPLLAGGADEHRILTAASGQGFRPLKIDGLVKVARGLTTLGEVFRVTEAGP
ncbi:MAG: Flp pilus assembly complex ATPase component TadA [Alphaproteobacteria bacterium]|nr:Flp pilus assembly complex ATPase component TadA [Alphaproteobacteria bacterium]